LFFNNIHKDITPQEFETECKKYGEVLMVFIKTDSEGKSLGYGYVQYASGEHA